MNPEMEGSDQQKETDQPVSRLNRPTYTPPSTGSSSGPAAPPPPADTGRTDTGRDRTSAPPPPKSSAGGKIIGLIVLLIVLYFGYGYLHNAGSTGGRMNAPIAQGDMLAAETQSPNYQKNKNARPGTPMRLSSSDFNDQATSAAIAAAEAGKPIPGIDSASPQLVDAIKKHEVKFITVRAYDSCAEDGDWVTLTTDNGSKVGSFMLTIAGRTVTIPVVNGQLPQMTLTGDRDGVGGITVGVETSGGTWYSGVLSPGESQPIPLVMQ